MSCLLAQVGLAVMSAPLTIDAEALSLRVTLDANATRTCFLGLPVLAGERTESLSVGTGQLGQSGSFEISSSARWLFGIGTAPICLDDGIADPARRLYREMMGVARGWHLSRIWNYVPAINAAGPDGLENYRAFCRGRSEAFEAEFGPDFKRRLPAASAVGCEASDLVVVFAASKSRPRHMENPRQVPAYEYPAHYGPRSPSFARATAVRDGADTITYISGTSAISGHETIAPFDTVRQLDCTLANLREMSLACGLGPDLAVGQALHGYFRVYLRNASDYAGVAAKLQSGWLRKGDAVCYVRADICRRELNVEIEATLRGVRLPAT
jgi:hypothetical protein